MKLKKAYKRIKRVIKSYASSVNSLLCELGYFCQAIALGFKQIANVWRIVSIIYDIYDFLKHYLPEMFGG